MRYKCALPESFKRVALAFDEFANGAAQASARLKDGRVFEKVLISNSSAIIAIRGFDAPPFAPDDIDEIFQTEEDKNPREHGQWRFWDDWR